MTTQAPILRNDASAIYKALLAAQEEIEAITKDADNPFFDSTYTTLLATINGCKKILNKNGILVVQSPQFVFDRATDTYISVLDTSLIHAETGETITGRMKLSPVKNDPQSLGSAITYAKRYSLQAMLFMATDDDDGNSASGSKPSKFAPVDRPPKPTDLMDVCPIHNQPMTTKFSEKKNTWYSFHKENDQYCFGRPNIKSQSKRKSS